MCQEANHIQKKPKEKLVMPTGVFGLITDAIIATKSVVRNNLTTEEKRNISVLTNVTQNTGNILCCHMNKILGRAAFPHMNPTGNGLRKTLKEWLTLKLADMPEKKMLKELIRLRNGNHYAENMATNALTAIKRRNLQKITSSLFRLGEPIIFPIFNHFAEVVIVENGKSFNTHQNTGAIRFRLVLNPTGLIKTVVRVHPPPRIYQGHLYD